MSRKPRTNLIDRSEFYEITGRLQHYACFHCRKAFKQPFPSPDQKRLCPQCRQPMTNMGTDFKAPPHKEVEQWRKVQLLADAGIRFFPYWRTDLPGERPGTLAEVPAFLRRVQPPSAGAQFPERDLATRQPPPKEGRLKQHGRFPEQTYSFLGQPLESGCDIEVFAEGAWQPMTFISRGNGNVAIPQPFAQPRQGAQVCWNALPLFLTEQERMRWRG